MHAYYLTRDAEIVQAVRGVFAADDAFRREAIALGESLDPPRRPKGRNALVTGVHEVVGWERLDGEPWSKSAWKDTPFIYEPKSDYLRPRNNAEGNALRDRMKALNSPPPMSTALPGVPANTGTFGLATPGVMVTAEGDGVVVTYTSVVEHDDRWVEIKASEFHRFKEERAERDSGKAAA